jgi:hypothetical protein
VNNAIANQLDWSEINEIIEEAQENNHEVALAIKKLKLEINHITLELRLTFKLENELKFDIFLKFWRNLKAYIRR